MKSAQFSAQELAQHAERSKFNSAYYPTSAYTLKVDTERWQVIKGQHQQLYNTLNDGAGTVTISSSTGKVKLNVPFEVLEAVIEKLTDHLELEMSQIQSWILGSKQAIEANTNECGLSVDEAGKGWAISEMLYPSAPASVEAAPQCPFLPAPEPPTSKRKLVTQ